MAIDDVDEPARKSPTVLVREMAATPAQAGILRDILVDWAQGHGLPQELAEDLKLAAYEAMANAVTHAYPKGADGTMTVTASLEPGTVTITIADSGRWEDRAGGTHGGRGLVLIRALTPEVSVTSTPIGTTVRMVWPWSPT